MLVADHSVYYSQANSWLGKVLRLAREWELNLDEIRIQFVCDLYTAGCDNFANEVIFKRFKCLVPVIVKTLFFKL